MVGASLLTVTFLRQGDRVTIGLSEIPLVVGVVFLSPVGLLLATVLALTVVRLVKRRPPSKTALMCSACRRGRGCPGLLPVACAATARRCRCEAGWRARPPWWPPTW